jgi:hypothetical protein
MTFSKLLFFSFFSVLGTVSGAQFDDLPNEMLLKIIESGPPSHLISVNHRFQSLPIPCQHYPQLLSAAIKRHAEAPELVDKCISVIRGGQLPLQCFGKDSLGQAIVGNASSLALALWDRRDELAQRQNSGMSIEEWIGTNGLAMALYYGHTELVQSLASVGLFTNSDLKIRVNEVHQLVNDTVQQTRVLQMIETSAGPVPRSENYYLAAVYGSEPEILHSLFDAQLPLPSYAFNAATLLKKMEAAKVMVARSPEESTRGMTLSLRMELLENPKSDMCSWLASVAPTTVRSRLARMAALYDQDYVVLPLLEGLPYNDVAQSLVSSANRGNHSLELFRTIFTHFGGLDYWKKETIFKALQSALLLVAPEEYTYHTDVADYILSLNIFSHQELLQLIDYHALIAEAESRYCAMATWPRRVAYLKAAGIDVQSAVDDTLAAHLADRVDARNALNKPFYKSILGFSPSKNNPHALIALIDERRDYWVLQHLLGYGMMVTKEVLDFAKARNRGAYNLLQRAFKKQ